MVDIQHQDALGRLWKQALNDDVKARAEWHVSEGGSWDWKNDGLYVQGGGTPWSGLNWQRCSGPTLRELNNFVLEVKISGTAEAAGFSFGAYKDFLTPLEPAMGTRHLQLEVDTTAGWWAFRVNGQLMQRAWWDGAIHSTEDILNGVLTLKGCGVQEVHFSDLAIRTFEASCQVSVILTCYRFLQRLRLSLHNWCNQDAPLGSHEILIVNPESPDGTHEYLAVVSSSYPHVRIREIAVEPALATNKGKMINRAVAMSRGEWIWLTDADMLFAPKSITHVVAQVNGKRQNLFYGQRRYLSASQTNDLLSGRINGLTEFATLAQIDNPHKPDNTPWGYTQIVHRSTIEHIRYREDINHFAHSDSVFLQECKRRRILPQQIDGLIGLHLDHTFAWYGTQTFL